MIKTLKHWCGIVMKKVGELRKEMDKLSKEMRQEGGVL